MQQMHHTLKKDLTRTLLIWSGAFFIVLAIVFSLSCNTLQGYILKLIADHRLEYQTAEFARHIDENDRRSIREEGDALVEEPLISAMLLIDASGRLLSASIHSDERPILHLSQPVTPGNLQSLVSGIDHLHLFTRPVPGHRVPLALIMDDRPVRTTIFVTAAWAAALMLILVLLSITALHRALERRLIVPIYRVRQAVEREDVSDDSVVRLERELPEEASDILDIYQHLRHSHDDLKEHIMDMMQVLPACFWWSTDGIRYSGISGKSMQILNIPPDSLQRQELWSWGPAEGQRLSNKARLQDAIRKQREHLDFAYQGRIGNEVRWFGETITICYDRKGRLDCVYGIINDISVRKQQQQIMDEQMQMAERMDTTATLVGGIAHEFNNALAGMQGNLYLIRQQLTDDQSRERLDRIETLIRRSAGMIEQMLVFARKSQIKQVRTDLKRFMRDFEAIIRPTLDHDTRLELQLPATDEQLAVHADQAKLQEALTHLIHNAVQATRETPAPAIRMSLERFDADEEFIQSYPHVSSRKLVRLRISDNGEGIGEDIQKHIFEPFFTTREVGQGTGLGLPMVYGYVRRLGGSIHVHSAPGEGTDIDLYLPRQADEIRADEHSGEIIHGHGETILVIDDEPAFREAACQVLEGLGYRPLAACDGQEGLRRFEEHRQDIALIVLDVVMPGKSGPQVAESIRAVDAKLPILFSTAFDLTDSITGIIATEHTDMIHKPFRVSVLSQAIRRLLSPAGEEHPERP